MEGDIKMLEEKIVYQIYPIGLCDSYYPNDFKSPPQEKIKIIGKWIPHIKDLGVTTILFNPLFESVYHGYDTKDFFSVDRRIGTNTSFRKLVEEIHLSGMEVMLDGVFNHVGREFSAFKDLKKNKEKSQYIDWFKNVDFDSNNHYNDGFSYDNWNGHDSLVKLNLGNHEVVEYIFNVVKFWIKEFDIDGLRLDAADCLDTEFIKELNNFTRNLKKDFFLVSEVIHGDYNRYINDRESQSVTNYECYKGFYSSLNDKNMFEIAYSLNRQYGNDGIYRDKILLNFVDNHDVSRIATAVNSSFYLYPIHILLFTVPGIPSIYYGSEWGIEGVKDDSDKKIRPYIDIEDVESTAENRDLIKTIKKLIEIRKNSSALKYGNYAEICKEAQFFSFKREMEKEKVIVFVNTSESEYHFNSLNESGKYRDVLNDEAVVLNGNDDVKIPAFWGRILLEEC